MAGTLKRLTEAEPLPGRHRWFTGSMTIDTTLGDSDILDVRQFEAVAIKPPASVTAIAVYASDSADGTFVLCNDIGTAGEITLPASKWTSLPAGFLAHGFLKFVPTGGEGTALVVAKS